MMYILLNNKTIYKLSWLICVMSFYRVFGAKGWKGATRKPAKWWLFRVFAWRPFAPPHESTTLFMRRLFASCLSYLCLARRKFATRKPAKITIWCVFAWRPFAPQGKDTTNRGENANGRHAKTRQLVTFSCFRMATFRPATRKYATFHALRFRLLFVVFLPGEANGRHAKTRQNHLLAGFRVATFRVFAPKTRLYDMA